MKKKGRKTLKQRIEAERARRKSRPEPLAFFGSRYKREGLVPMHFQTESAIYEAAMMTRGWLSDHHVRSGLESLIRQMQHGPLPPFQDTEVIRIEPDMEHEFVVWNIRRHWDEMEDPPPASDVLGVVRTILADVIARSSDSPLDSRRYLAFLADFMSRAGVEVGVAEDDEFEEDEDDRDRSRW